MKIGILTFHRAHNYGAVLQCYALTQYLKSLGNDVFIIDYSSDYVQSCYKLVDLNRIKSKNPMRMISKLINEIQVYPIRKSRAEKFDTFINKYFSLLSPNNIDNLDVIVVGSDQVWNTRLTHGFDKYYWGNFIRSKNTQLISYAASIEEFWDSKCNYLAIKYLNEFDAISVREETTAICMRKLLSRKVEVGLDPTLLLDEVQWLKCATNPNIKEPYLLLYQVRVSHLCYEIAKKISEIYNIKIVFLSARADATNSIECACSSPEEFLGLFKNATFIVCSSFHGTVFSCIFKRQFYSIRINDGKDSRVENLLNLFGLEERLIQKIPDSINEIDYNSVVCNKLKIEESYKYLKCNTQ